MSLTARKFTIEVPTVQEASTVWSLKETGFATAADVAALRAGLNDGSVYADMEIPGTGLQIDMVKKSLEMEVAGPGVIRYSIAWQEPVASNPAVVPSGVVENVTDQLGSSPATATVSLTGKTIPNPSYDLGTALVVTHRSSVVFRGWVTDVDFSSSTGQTGTTLMTGQDARWFLSGVQVGQHGGLDPSYKVDDLFDVVFNKDNSPDKKVGSLLFNRGSRDAETCEFWTYADVLEALLTWYGANLIGGVADFVAAVTALPGGVADEPIPMLDLQAQPIIGAIDQVVRMIPGRLSWRLDFSASPPLIKLVNAAGSATTRTIKYRTSTIDQQFATQANVRKSVTGCYHRAEVHGGKVVMETHLGPDDWNSSQESQNQKYAWMFWPKQDVLNTRLKTTQNLQGRSPDLAGRESGAFSYQVSRTLVSRWNGADRVGPGATDIDLVDSMQEEPYLYVSVDDGSTWYLLDSGFEIDHDSGRIFVGETDEGSIPKVQYRVDLNAENKQDLLLEGDVKFRATLAFVMDYREVVASTFTNNLPSTTALRARVNKDDSLALEWRIKSRDRGTPSGGNWEPGTEFTDAQHYLDASRQTATLAAMVEQGGGTLWQGGVTAPYAPLAFPGDKLVVQNFTRWPAGVDMWITSMKLEQQRQQYTVTLQASNQFWQENVRVQPDPKAMWWKAKVIQDRFIQGRSLGGGS